MQVSPFHTTATPNVHHILTDCRDLPSGSRRLRGTHGWPMCPECLKRSGEGHDVRIGSVADPEAPRPQLQGR